VARIRTVKIGFFRNEQLATFSFAHRLLFEGLWLIADKAGRLEDRPRRIKADLFPYDDGVDVDGMLADLAGGSDPFVSRYQVAGKSYIQVCNFDLHQRPHHTEPPSTFPGPNTDTCVSSPLSHGEATDSQPSDSARKGREGKDLGKEGNGEDAPPEADAIPPEALADAWNELTSKPIPACREFTDKRKRAARLRLKERPLLEWRLIIAKIQQSPFCRGETDRGDWVATFDFLLQPDTATKVLEGKYDSRGGGKAAKGAITPENMRYLARQLGPGSWASECLRIHDGKCGGANAHEELMAVAS
jgi:hypothetical protein